MIGLFWLAAAGAAPAAAPVPPPPFVITPVQPASTADARALAEIVAPRETLLQLNLHWAERAILDMPTHSEDSSVLESEFPGIHRAMWSAAEPELRRQVEADIPNLWGRLAEVYGNLTHTELQGLVRFFRTPTGQRVITGLYGNLDLAPAIPAIVSDDEGRVDEALDAAEQAATRKTVEQLKPDESDIQILMTAITVEKLQALGVQAKAATDAWFKDEDPDQQAKIDALVAGAAERYMEDFPETSN